MSKEQVINNYVSGITEKAPDLQPFSVPNGDYMVKMTPAVCFCGCGRIEGWSQYWTNKWIVYVPGKKLENKS